MGDGTSQVTLRLFRLPISQFRLCPECNGGERRAGEPPAGSRRMTSAPRSARMRPHSSPDPSARSRTRRWSSRSASRAGQDFDPALHECLSASQVGFREPAAQVDAIDRIQRPREVRFIAIRQRRVDTHATLEAGVRSGPLFVTSGHSLLRLKRLTDAAWYGVEDVSVWVHSRGERPHDVVHAVDVDVDVDGDGQPHPLARRQDRAEEVTLPAFLDLVALLDLDDAATPVGHTEGNVHVLNDAWLQAFA